MKLIEDIKAKFYLLIAIAAFYPSVLSSFFNINAINQSDNIFLKATTLLVYYLAGYIFFEFAKNKTPEKWLRWLEILLLISIASFIIPLTFASNNIASLSQPQAYLFGISLGFQTGMVVVIISFLVFSVSLGNMKKEIPG